MVTAAAAVAKATATTIPNEIIKWPIQANVSAFMCASENNPEKLMTEKVKQ